LNLLASPFSLIILGWAVEQFPVYCIQF